jgi:hypothetical protein
MQTPVTTEHGQHGACFSGVGGFVQEMLAYDHRGIRRDQDLIGCQRTRVGSGFFAREVFGDLCDGHAGRWRFVHIGARYFHRQVKTQKKLSATGRSGGQDQTPGQVHGM